MSAYYATAPQEKAKLLQKHLASAKWYLWHGNTQEAISQVDSCLDICDLPEFKYPKRKKLVQYIEELIVYLKNNQSMLPNYGERYRYNEPISTSFVESTVNEVVSKRMAKKQQMQWSQQGAHYLLQTRTTVLNGELETVFEGWYPELKGKDAPQFFMLSKTLILVVTTVFLPNSNSDEKALTRLII